MSGEESRRRFEEHFDYLAAITSGAVEHTAAAMERWWAPDVTLWTDGGLVCDGFPAMVEHYETFSERFASAAVERPFHWFREAGELVAIEFELVAVPAGAVEPIRIHILAVCTMADGRIAEMRQVAYGDSRPADTSTSAPKEQH